MIPSKEEHHQDLAMAEATQWPIPASFCCLVLAPSFRSPFSWDDHNPYPVGKLLQFTNWKITMLNVGKSTMSMAMFSQLCQLCQITRGYHIGGQ